MNKNESKRWKLAGGFFAFVAIILAIGAIRTQAAPELDDDTSDIMRKKLSHAQKAMEGLSLEDFSKIKAAADELQLLTQEARWKKIQSPKYLQESAEFSEAVTRMGDMAQQKNLDGATLAFVRVTMTCVECHKVVRGGQSVAKN